MKKILITGANSYIGTSFEAYLKNFKNEYQVDTLDMLDPNWRETSFSGYDAIFHVAAIVHKNEKKCGSEIYYKINTELTLEIAIKAKKSGVGQFVFLSSMSVYGKTIGRIDRETVPDPNTHYGKSKFQAEQELMKCVDNEFCIAIIRPPIVYGKGCKGNYQSLSKFARKMKIFPYVKNERSMLYIENLCEFVRLVIENKEDGIFFPQNAEYSNTSRMVEMIAMANGKKIYLVKGFTWLLKLLRPFVGLINKAFGNLTYDTKLSEYKQNYTLYNLEESILRTEK